MNLDFSALKYIVQIPRKWFQDVNDVCFRSYGGWLIHIKDGDNNAKEIYVDYDEFKQAVEAIGGSVKSVDGIFPDATGNVDFGLTPSKWLVSDANGHITTCDDEPVLSVDGVTPDANGDVDFGLTGSKYVVTDSNGHLTTTDDEPVLSVDGVTPDANGDVDFGLTGNKYVVTDSNGHLSTTTEEPVLSVDGISPDNNGNVNFGLTASKWLVSDANGHITTSASDPITVSATDEGVIYNNYGSLLYLPFGTTNGTVAAGNHTHGNINTFGFISPQSGKNGNTLVITDEFGMMTTSEYTLKDVSGIDDVSTILALVDAFNWVNGTPYLDGVVYSVDDVEPDVDGNIDFGLTPNSFVTTDNDGHLTTATNTPVLSVDGVTPDSSGDVDFGLTANSWVATDANGHLTTDNTARVTTVDEITPDANGNIDFGLTANKWLVSDGSGHITTSASDPITVSAQDTGVLFNQQGTLHYIPFGTVAGTVAVGNHTHGNINTFGFISPQSGKNAETLVVTDEFGMMTTSEYSLKDISGINDVPTIVAITNAFDWVNGTPHFKGLVNSVNSIQPDNTGNVVVPCVYTVNHKQPDQQGNVDVGMPDLEASKWVKTDENGDLTTTDADPITVDTGATGFLYNNAGTLSYIPFGPNANQVAMGNHTHNTSALNNDAGFITSSYLTQNNYTTTSDVDTIIQSYNYTTEEDVEDIVDDMLDGYVTLDTVQTITANKYFGPNVNSAILVASGNAAHSIQGIGKALDISDTFSTTIRSGTGYVAVDGTNSEITINAHDAVKTTSDTYISSISGGNNVIRGLNIYVQAKDSSHNTKGDLALTGTVAQMRFGTGAWFSADQTDAAIGIGAGSDSKSKFVAKNERTSVLNDNAQLILENDGAELRWTPTNGGASKLATVLLTTSLDNKSQVGVKGELVVLDAPANDSILNNQPTIAKTETSSRAIATCGWVASNFGIASTLTPNKWVKTNDSGKLVTVNDTPLVLSTSNTGFVYNTNGTPSYISFGTGANQVAMGNHSHNTSALNNDAGFLNETQVEDVIESYSYVDEAEVEDIIEAHDFATHDDLEGYVTLDTPQLITAGKRFGPTQADSLWIGKGAVNNSISSTTSPLSLYGDNVAVLLTSSSDKTTYIHLNPDGRIVTSAPEQYLVLGKELLLNSQTRAGLRTMANNSIVSCVDTTAQDVKLWHGTGGWISVSDDGVSIGDGATTNGRILVDNTNDRIYIGEGGSSGSHFNMTNNLVLWKIGPDGDYSKRIVFDNSSMALRHDTALDLLTMGEEGIIRITKGDATKRLTISDSLTNLRHDTRVEINSLGESGAIVLNTRANYAALANAPTVTPSNTTTRAIATCGWTSSNFAPKGTLNANKWVKTDANGKLVSTDDTPIVASTSLTGFIYNNKGTLSYIPFGSGANQVAMGNHSHNTSALNNDAGFVNTSEVRSIVQSYNYLNEAQVEDVIESYDYATHDDLNGYVTLDTPQLITAGKRFGPSQADSLWIGKGAVNNSISSTTSPLSLYGDNVAVLVTSRGSTKTSSIHVNANGSITAEAPEQLLATGNNLLLAANSLSSIRVLQNNNVLSTVEATTQDAKMRFGTGGWITLNDNGVLMGDGASANGTFIIDNANDKINLSEGGSTGSHFNMTSTEVVCKIGQDGDYSKRIGFNNTSMAVRHDTRLDIISIGEEGKVVINTRPNYATLTNAPTVAITEKTSKAIATCGWTSTNFAPKGTLNASKWVKTDASGKLVTTDDTPVTLSTSTTGFLYNTSGTLSYLGFGSGANQVARGNHTHNTSALNNDAGFVNAAGVNSIIDGRDFVSESDLTTALSDYVTLATNQTITGSKSFGSTWETGTQFVTGAQYNRISFGRYTIMNTLNNNTRLTIQASSGEKYLDFNPSYNEIRLHSNGRTVIESTGMSYMKGEGVHLAATDSVGSDLSFVSLANNQVKMQCGSSGGNVLTTANGVQIGKALDTYISVADEGIGIGNGAPAVNINARANETTLSNAPTVNSDNTESKAVATCGWVASKFQTKPETTVTGNKYVVTSVNWNGTQLTYIGETWNFENGILKSVTPDAIARVIDTPVAY